ncbi:MULTISPECIES: HEPN domain-containing protein [unclassified Vibrio]|uniref:HEPN domain-containing protein n=2 Tax=Vibrio TaxID=662 RepID=UPI0029650B20|nr:MULTISPECIES: HEPN domain-containing protein [unclassified Vibrio]MDW1591742.1 HEPN domain-containing protein [Vibrio sp. Vb2944]MDW1610518.1 HEPN domain-containing protein [Vibrio sp. Vb2908]MDW1725241.1 HEPN domain-containing protein [Vibrio sp. Vb2909]
MNKPPFFIFRKNLYRISVVHKISDDIKVNDCAQFEYKNMLLNQSYLVYMVALWQGYIENLATYYFEIVVYEESNPSILSVMKSKHDVTISRFNTPSADGINTVFNELFGIKKISDYLDVDGVGNKETKKRLNQILKCRHEIAHTAFCKSAELNNQLLLEYRSFFLKLAVNLEGILQDKLNGSLNGFFMPKC